MKKFLAMLLALAMVLSLAACGSKAPAETTAAPAETTGTAVEVDTNGIPAGTYTYNTYATSLATNWNPHTWEMNSDSIVLDYIASPLADMTVENSEEGIYQWIFSAATDIVDVTAEHQDDLVKYGSTLPEGKTAEEVTSDYVYEIKLREGMMWQDGTPIDADTYIYSMQQLLDPVLKNYRANNYYSGESALAGAYDYYYSLEDGLYVGYTTKYATLAEAVEAEDVYIDCWDFWGAKGYIDAEGNEVPQYVLVTDETLYSADGAGDDEFSGASLYAGYGAYMEVGGGYESSAVIFQTNEAKGTTWDAVGLYKVDDYTIRYVCQVAYAYDYFLTSCTSNWIVHEELYEACKEYDDAGNYTGTKYGTDVEYTMSYGPYKMTSLEDAKQMVFEQNENYWEYTKDSNGNLYSVSTFEVDGQNVPQWLTQKLVINVMQNDAAKLAFLAGELDDWACEADDVITYSTSERLYKVDETYTMRLFFHTNLDTLKTLDAEGGNVNSVVLSNKNFRKAMSFAIDRAELVTATAAYKPAYSMLSSLYFYNVYEDPTSIYRNSEPAMQAICNLYGVEYGEGTPYADMTAAYKSINGYNVTEATELFKLACEELVAEGLYTEGADIKIQLGYSAGAMSAADHQYVALLNKYFNAAAEGTGIGNITIEAVDNLNNRYNDVANGVYAMGHGAWGGAAFYPYTMFQVYCDDEYVNPIHEKGSWDPATETLTMDVKGEEVTMTWKDWSRSMAGTGPYANEPHEVKLQILANMEENMLGMYNLIPLNTTTACSMLSYKMSYYTENYSIMYGFGGLRLMNYNYTDAEWAEFVAENNGQIGY